MITDKKLTCRLLMAFAQEAEELGLFASEALDAALLRGGGALGEDDAPTYARDIGLAIGGAASGLAARMRFELLAPADDVTPHKGVLTREIASLVAEAERLGQFAVASLYDDLLRANEAEGYAETASYAQAIG
ncbi:hypothetical protein BVG79_00168 [Ketogulonicigenium robustum]|uniref:Uncharacterized protein n=1 Tax=Ketogulonicigenium robustum TaxID=92947 RepID=A0A1W6NW92_9RHOB|nr:hypothetical protein [Ketogulonicigenium robustum]ARO13528.1 hypothetical protein BVG79_00168 [Ketogulonicigenium robustum]